MVDPVPSEEEQDWLLDSLADLVERFGPGPLVGFPILHPTARFFPEPWAPSAAGVERLVKRLLRYAGLPFERATVEVPPEDDEQTAILWFDRWDGDVARFGASSEIPEEAERVVEVACYAVARAYRARHELVQADDVDEGPWVEVTATFLGFGILVANAAHKYRQDGHIDGNIAITHYSHSSLGYLSPQARCFLLAAQCVVRGADRGLPRRLADQLETNQAAFFRKSLAVLEGTDVAARLCLPPPASWPTPPVLDSLLAPLQDTAAPMAPMVRVRRPLNLGRITFRVKRTRVAVFGLLSGVLAALVSVIVAGAVAVPTSVLAAIVVVGTAAGGVLGRLIRNDECSDPDCTAYLPPDVTTCPGCAGRIMGTIASPKDRLEAEEALERRPPRGYRDAPDPRGDEDA